MTRIIAGCAGGRTVHTPRGAGTRPTTDRVREAMFSRIESLLDLEGCSVLDLYAGSGALGLEAASRGAARVLAVERHRATARLIGRSAEELALPGVEVVVGPVGPVLAAGPGGHAYHLALLDPPYPLPDAELAGVLHALGSGGWLDPDALVVVERSARSPRPPWPETLRHLDTRRYGETALHLAEPTGPAGA
ncbi:16S rRNA (guanine(966)-N(2))-methyltransferase RsmD [Serinicoccus marinus]|uniref:16S rRNA (guanine(966)-N(2))-methyltransferase RsmD n=1 Tax=Serinicoccus marinus TaxID=247333 RepID=UPI0003B546A9|nr:16S rRNA (guanine(966)-N(2))-methyltransferase RsmD [Serinicoccus marinus]